MNEKQVCGICGSEIVEKMIDYSDWNDGHLVVVRSVPIRECLANGHRFFNARTARSLERLLNAEKDATVTPDEMMQVPVFTLEPA